MHLLNVVLWLDPVVDFLSPMWEIIVQYAELINADTLKSVAELVQYQKDFQLTKIISPYPLISQPGASVLIIGSSFALLYKAEVANYAQECTK